MEEETEAEISVDVVDDFLIRCYWVGKEREVLLGIFRSLKRYQAFHLILHSSFIEASRHTEFFSVRDLDSVKKGT